MSGTVYYETKSKNQEDIDRAGEFLMNHEVNKVLRTVYCNVHLYHSLDLDIVKEENEQLLSWMQDNQGKSDIAVTAFATSHAEAAGFEIEDIQEMQIKVFEDLNKVTQMQYHAYSSGFDLSQDSFTIEQIKRITNNGKLLSYTDEYRVLYTQLLEEEPQVLKQSSKQLLQVVKEQDEDYEWYPTTKEIIEKLYWSIKERDKYDSGSSTYWQKSHISILDIGAGNGKLFSTLREISDENPDTTNSDRRTNHTELGIAKAYAIEKSQTLINSLDSDVFVIGTDFHEQTLIDKKVDVVFCNPPYSEFAQWSEKIIKEANAEVVYLVIPDRWEKDLAIAKAIELRGAKVTIEGSFSFLDAEDRKARANVHLVKISLMKYDEYANSNRQTSDPFDTWFDEVFKVNAQKTDSTYSENEKRAKRIKNLVTGNSLIPRLKELYDEEFQHLLSNYSKVAELDADLLKELNVSVKGLKEALKMKIEGLKNLYWKELFDNLDTITSRLTSKSRESLLGTLTSNTSVDFTVTNAYSIVLWAIKNANKYYDSQLLSIYMSLSNPESVNLYKSNKRFIKDDWRYSKEKMTHYSLDYRIVDDRAYALDYGVFGDDLKGIKANAATGIQDIFIVARNLGFNIESTHPANRDWFPGRKINFTFSTGETTETFVEVKAFKNGNLHYKFNQQFMKALNIEAARLNGWIKSPQEACEEFDISEEEAKEMFNSSFVLTSASVQNLLPSKPQQKHYVTIQDDEVKISFEPDSEEIHCGDMVEYEGEWIEVTFSNDNHLIICGEVNKYSIELFPEVASKLTGHKSQFERIEAIKTAYDELASPAMEYYAQRNKVVENSLLNKFEIHADVLNYAYWLYELAYTTKNSIRQSGVMTEAKATEVILPANIIIDGPAVEDIQDDMHLAHANGTLF